MYLKETIGEALNHMENGRFIYAHQLLENMYKAIKRYGIKVEDIKIPAKNEEVEWLSQLRSKL